MTDPFSPEAARTALEKMGVERVRAMGVLALPQHLQVEASKMIAEDDVKKQQAHAAAMSEQTSLARSAVRAAWLALWVSIVAIVVAIAGIFL